MNPMLPLLFGFIVLAGPLRGAVPLASVGFAQRIGATLPLASEVIELDGSPHALRDYFQGRPVVLRFGYANCPQLCSVVADGTVAALRQIRLKVGRDFDVIALSIDPHETAAAAEARWSEDRHRYGDPRTTGGWHYLRASEESIRAIADAAGFHFTHDLRSGQYAHASGFVVVTPQGVISRYFLGVDFDAASVSRAIGRAARGETGDPVLAVLLRCFRGDGEGGKYSGAIHMTVLLSAVATALALGAWIGRMLREERRLARARLPS